MAIHKGLPESGTIKLSDLKAGLSNTGSFIGANTFSSVANGTVTAPATATWVRIEAYGGGGGGKGYGGLEAGGGGGGFSSYEMPVEGGVTSFGYRVGGGGAGGGIGLDGNDGGYSFANGDFYGITTMYAYGGKGGEDIVGGAGGDGAFDFRAGTGTNSPKKRGYRDAGDNGGTGTYWYGGDAGGPGGGIGGKSSSGTNGGAPGGGGAGGYSFNDSGGDGATGRVAFVWYNGNVQTSKLRDFMAGGSEVAYGDLSLTGNNQNIPSSGTVRLKMYYSCDELGYNANTTPTNDQFTMNDYDSVQSPSIAVAKCNLAINQTTGEATHSYNWGKPIDHALNDTSIDSEILSRYQVQFMPTLEVESTVTGSATNTWITMSNNPKWWFNVTRSTIGTTIGFVDGYLRYRRTLDNVEVVNVKIQMTSTAEVYDDFDTK